jgi:hypothetical protein
VPEFHPKQRLPLDPRASNSYPKLFALGGCAKFVVKESYLGVPKMEAQAKTISFNIRASIKGTKVPVDERMKGCRTFVSSLLRVGRSVQSDIPLAPHPLPPPLSPCKLKKHSEGMPSMSNAPAIIVGHHTHAALVTEVMPAPLACALVVCGSPCNMLCPCFAVGVWWGACDAGACGAPCGAPEGRGTAQCLWKYFLSGLPAYTIGYTGMGAKRRHEGERPPASVEMDRDSSPR